jgi:putative Mg2+ transporter-C (MgtC) family protein
MIDDDWTTIAVRLGLATLAGLILGFEREWRGRDAGLRTHALVALSSAMITVSALLLSQETSARGGESDPVRVIQGLAQAIGFIAGGLIFVKGGDVRNMTTAASGRS